MAWNYLDTLFLLDMHTKGFMTCAINMAPLFSNGECHTDLLNALLTTDPQLLGTGQDRGGSFRDLRFRPPVWIYKALITVPCIHTCL